MQVGKGSRGDVTILPTLVVNNRQYRGWSLCFYFADMNLDLPLIEIYACLQENWRKVLF